MQCHQVMCILAIFLLSACATPYQESAETGGYEQRVVSEDVYVITFHGNGFTKAQRVKDFSMLRAAEIGKQLKYTHFVILGKQDLSSSEVISTGSTTTANGTVYSSGSYGSYSGTSTTTPTLIPVYRPAVEMAVKYFEGYPEGRYLEIHQIDEVLETMRTRYRIKNGE